MFINMGPSFLTLKKEPIELEVEDNFHQSSHGRLTRYLSILSSDSVHMFRIDVTLLRYRSNNMSYDKNKQKS